jgi:hypothetical protein
LDSGEEAAFEFRMLGLDKAGEFAPIRARLAMAQEDNQSGEHARDRHEWHRQRRDPSHLSLKKEQAQP